MSREARPNQVKLSELQIDFDCAESKLDGYRVWVEAIQRRVAPLPVTITALPSWLDARAFKRLASVATNYVLQVHSLERPTESDAPFTLVRSARGAAGGGAGRADWRAFSRGLADLRLHAGVRCGRADSSAFPPKARARTGRTNAQMREVGSDPLAMAALVQGWTASRPAAMRGVIWYRLPTVVDNFNWRWPTLGAIVRARSPGRSCG